MSICILDITFLVGQEIKELSGVVLSNGNVHEQFHYVFRSLQLHQDETFQSKYARENIHGLTSTDGSEPIVTLQKTLRRISQRTNYCFMKGSEKCMLLQKYLPESYPPIIDLSSLGCESFQVLFDRYDVAIPCMTHLAKHKFYHKSCSLLKMQILLKWVVENIVKLDMSNSTNRRLTFGNCKLKADTNQLAVMGFMKQVGDKTSLFCVNCRSWTKLCSFEQHECFLEKM